MAKSKTRRNKKRRDYREALKRAQATGQHFVSAPIRQRQKPAITEPVYQHPNPAPEIPDEEEWHCVMTNIKCERRAASGLEAKGFTVYVPSYRESLVRKGRRVDVTRFVFPRYLFVAFRPARVDDAGREFGGQYWSIKLTDGVEAIIRDPITGRPIRIPREQIAMIAELEIDKPPPAPFLIGQVVEILAGPFAKFKGPVEEIGPEGVKVGASIFGRPTPVILGLRDVRAA